MPVTNITLPRFYPTLASVVNKDEIPEALGFIKTSIELLLNSVHYKDLQYSKSPRGDAAFYSLSIVSKNRIDIEIPGTGIFLVLNPDVDDTNISAFPITIEYEWKVLAYLRSFNLDQFDFSPKAFFETALRVLSISEKQAIASFINTFTEPVDGNTNLEQFVKDLNDFNADWGLLTPTQETTVTDVVKDIFAKTNEYATIIAFASYIAHNDLNETKRKLKAFFKSLLPQDIEAYIKDILIPKIAASLTLTAGIEFPRSMLQPVDATTLEVLPQTNDDGSPRAGFRFAEAIFYAGTEGFGYEMELALSSTTPAMIGKTGLIIEFINLKIDLQTDENIPEADADGRGLDFKGVYIEYAAITLPAKWFNDDEVVGGVTARIAGYNLLIGTGGISGTIALESKTFKNSDGSILNYYTDYFTFNYPIQTRHLNDENTLVVTTIDNHQALKTQLENFDATQFVFPLSLTEVGTNKVLEFKNVTDYFTYINTLYDHSDEANRPRLSKRIGTKGFEMWFTSFDITFKQGKVIDSNIEGGLIIPKLKDAEGNIANIDIKGHLDEDGDFLVTASEKDGFQPIRIPQVLDIVVKSLEVGKEDGDFFIGVAADLIFTNPVMVKLLKGQTISIPRLRIYSDGSFEIVGGPIEVPTSFTLDLGPVEIAVTGINFSSYQQEHQGKMRKYNVFGFDGGISLNPLGIDARGEGIKYYYTVDNNTEDIDGNPLPPTDPEYREPHSYIRIQTIRVELVIPGSASPSTATAIIKGYLSISEDEYKGKVSLKLPKARIAGSAEMRLQPKYPAFIVDASIEIPTPIPLGATGLGVYGFRGILGYRYVAEKEAIGLTSGEDTWYDYYTYPKRGINLEKFNGPNKTSRYKNPVSLGAGASIATYGSDSVLSLRVLVLLSIPSLFLIEGRANILGKRYGLDDSGEPPFFAFLAIGDNSIEAGLGADFSVPKDNGWILELYAEIQAGFFFNNPSAWYINVGTKEKPITSRLLTLITAQSYLMLSARGIEMGARAEFEFDKKYGPVRVRAYAYVEVGGFISFERPQLGAYFAIGGEALIDVKILSLYISLDLMLSAEAAKPFLLYGKFRLCVKVRIFFIRIRFCGNVELKWEKSRSVDRTPIAPLLPEQAESTVKAMHMLNGDAFDLIKLNNSITNATYAPDTNDVRFDTNVIPIDSYIDIKFNKGLLPNTVSSKIGGVTNPPESYTDLIPPQKVINGRTVRQVKHQYSIEEIIIKAAVGNQWVDYHPYQALDSTENLSHLKIGQWQKSGNEYNAVRLLATSPFSFTQQGEPEWFIPEQVGVTAASLFCEGVRRSKGCSNWLKKPLNTRYLADRIFRNSRVFYTLEGESFMDQNNRLQAGTTAIVTNLSNPYNFARSLQFNNINQLEILLPEEAVSISLTLSTYAQGVTIKYYSAILNDDTFEVQYNLALEIHKTIDELAAGAVEYNNTDVLISKIRIEPDFANLAEIQTLQEQIQALFTDTYIREIANGNTSVDGTLPFDQEQYGILLNQLNTLLDVGCSKCAIDDPRGGIGRMQIGNTFCVGDSPAPVNDCTEETRCFTLLHEVCWLNIEDYEYNFNIPAQDAIQQDFEDASEAITKIIDPVWRPNTKYYVHFKLKDTVDNGNNEGNYDYFYGFRTAGPVGHFHRDQGSTFGDIIEDDGSITEDSVVNPDRYLLTSLRAYIDYKRSYPNADGNLLRSKPLFYGKGELMIFFNNPSTYHMFANWPEYNGLPALKSEMKFFVKDPTNDTIIEHPMPPDVDITNIPQTVEAWTADTEPLMPEYLQMLNNFVQEQQTNPDLNCVLTGGDAIIPASNFMTVTFKDNLKPKKLYTALVNNIFEGVTREVHNYVFQTSRYIDFNQQVNSYKLSDKLGNSKDAVFVVALHVSQQDITTAYNTIVGINDTNSSNLETQYLDLFDRITEGILGFKPIDPPQTTEFNVLRNINTNEVIAILIRNPEPFNDPKIPLDEISNTISVVTNGVVDTTYKSVFSKDFSQVIMMPESNIITAPELSFRFQYLKWDGTSYQISSEINVENINIENK